MFELTLSRANKSVRVFDHVVESLSNGNQPNLELLEKLDIYTEPQQFMDQVNLV